MRPGMQTFRKIFWIIVLIVGGGAVLLFGSQNFQGVTLKFFNWTSREWPLWCFIFLAFLAGVLFTGLVGLVEIFRMSRRLRKTRRLQELLEREVHALRNQPLYDEPPAAAASRPDAIEERLTHDGLPERVIQGVERG